MAKGKSCPYCKSPMKVESEKKEPAGSYVVYACKCGHKEKVFEDK